jgi:autotransporter-associated beta strand protein
MTFAGVLTGGGNLVQSGPGSLTLTGDLAGYTGTISISGGTLEVATPLLGATSIAFQAAASGRLQIDAQSAPAVMISGFAIGDVIDLHALAYDGFAAPAVNGSVVTVIEGGLSESLVIAGASLRTFRLSDDGSGGTNLQVACYCEGTLILTDRGECPVETLAIGDTVVTAAGQHRPVRWIGRRSYVGRFLIANPTVADPVSRRIAR